MKNLLTYVLCLLIAVAPGCSFLTPAQKESGKAALQDAYEKGQITAKQRDDAIASLEKGDASGLGDWLTLGGSVLASVLLGVPVSIGAVQRVRGPSATDAERKARAAARA